MDKDIAALKDIALFKNLAPEKIQSVMHILRKVTFSANEIIMREGDIGDTMYIILDGTVEIAKSLILDDADNEELGKNKVFTRLDGKQYAVFG
jgi:CRP/FNR family transcriptional regulator, cyclic AMP receptor protein